RRAGPRRGAAGSAPRRVARGARPRGRAGRVRRPARARPRGRRDRAGGRARSPHVSAAGTPIALSLISHTNAGKTTLARTLLGRDVGEVRDAAHVTAEATPYPMIATPEGDALTLWDTPGFGDSTRLARRLEQQGNPIGWFLSEVWDRF